VSKVSKGTAEEKPFGRLHDALIHCIRSNDELLTISGTAGAHNWELKVDSVVCFVCTPFLSGNIILNVNLHKFGPEIRRDLSVSDSLISLFFDVYGPKETNTNFEGLTFLEVTSSYGAEILCLFGGRVDITFPSERGLPHDTRTP
jgi:hypothetical protein